METDVLMTRGKINPKNPFLSLTSHSFRSNVLEGNLFSHNLEKFSVSSLIGVH